MQSVLILWCFIYNVSFSCGALYAKCPYHVVLYPADCCGPYPGVPAAEMQGFVERMMVDLGLKPHEHKLAYQLSGGNKCKPGLGAKHRTANSSFIYFITRQVNLMCFKGPPARPCVLATPGASSPWPSRSSAPRRWRSSRLAKLRPALLKKRSVLFVLMQYLQFYSIVFRSSVSCLVRRCFWTSLLRAWTRRRGASCGLSSRSYARAGSQERCYKRGERPCTTLHIRRIELYARTVRMFVAPRCVWPPRQEGVLDRAHHTHHGGGGGALHQCRGHGGR